MRYILVWAIVLICTGTSIADLLILKEHAVEVGGEIFNIDFDANGVMRKKGLMYGGSAIYTYHNVTPTFMLRAEGRVGYGKVDFSSPSSGNLDNLDDYILEARGLAGYDFFLSQTLVVTLYTGIGYRYMKVDSSGKTSTKGLKGYERESNYYYSPIGIEFLSNLRDGWFFGGAVEYGILWSGKQENHFSDAVTSIGDREFSQHHGYGIRGSVKIKREGKVDFLLEPFIRYWSIDKSNESNVMFHGVIAGLDYEPKNETLEFGVSCGISF